MNMVPTFVRALTEQSIVGLSIPLIQWQRALEGRIREHFGHASPQEKGGGLPQFDAVENSGYYFRCVHELSLNTSAQYLFIVAGIGADIKPGVFRPHYSIRHARCG